MASGACIVASALNPKTKVIGVQSSAAPAAYLSWKEGKLVSDKMGTFAEGLATRVGFALTQEILRDDLDDFVLVSDEEIKKAILLLIEKTHNLVEAAGAAPLAALIKIAGKTEGKESRNRDERGKHYPRSTEGNSLSYFAAERAPHASHTIVVNCFSFSRRVSGLLHTGQMTLSFRYLWRSAENECLSGRPMKIARPFSIIALIASWLRK